MRRKAVAAVAAVLVAGMFGSPHAGAEDSLTDVTSGSSTVTATLAEIGSRSIAAVANVAFTGGLSDALTASYDVVVTEVARTGTNPWSITGQVCGSDEATGLTVDCTNRPNALYNGTTALGAANIAASSHTFVTLADTSTVQGVLIEGSGGGTPAAGSFSDFGDTRTLGTNTGQNTSLAYSGGYQATGSLSLTLPNGTDVGTYSGFFVVTLIN